MAENSSTSWWPYEQQEELRARAANLPRIQLSARNLCDLELLAIMPSPLPDEYEASVRT